LLRSLLVGDDDLIEEPSCSETGIVVTDANLLDFSEIDALKPEIIRLRSLKQVSSSLQFSLSAVTAFSIDLDEDVGVGSGTSSISSDDIDLVLDKRHSAHSIGIAGGNLSDDLLVIFVLVEPSSAEKVVFLLIRRIGDDDLIQEPSSSETGTVVTDSNLLQLTEIGTLDLEVVFLISFKVVDVVVERLLSGPALGSVHLDEDVGIRSGSSSVSGSDGNLIGRSSGDFGVGRFKLTNDLSVIFLFVEPSSAGKSPFFGRLFVLDKDGVQEPAGSKARAVVTDLDLLDVAQIHGFDSEKVSSSLFKIVGRVVQRSFSGIAILSK